MASSISDPDVFGACGQNSMNEFNIILAESSTQNSSILIKDIVEELVRQDSLDSVSILT